VAVASAGPYASLHLVPDWIYLASKLTTPAPPRPGALPAAQPTNQQCQLTEGIVTYISALSILLHTHRDLNVKKTVIIVMHMFDNNRSRLHI